MAAVVSHAMRRYPLSPPDTSYSSYDLRGESSWTIHKEEGESALSRSMRYADPWLYGTSRAPAGLVLAPTFMLCACPDYVSGTKRSNKKAPSTCKKCKGARLPLHAGGGTVRCYPSAHQRSTTSPVRAGTMRVSFTARPSILPTTDPYDLMRKSRMSVSSDGTAQQFRARSISPSKGKSAEQKNQNNLSLSKTKVAEISSESFVPPAVATAAAAASGGRRSILECDINPYELMSAEAEKPEEKSITRVNGQRIRVRPPSYDPDYEDVQVVQPPKAQAKAVLSSSETNGTSSKTNEKESDQLSRFKSILKKPTSFGDGDLPRPADLRVNGSSASHKSGSHFYLPMPGVSPRKKVQFLVENELVSPDGEDNGQDDELYENVESLLHEIAQERDDTVSNNGISEDIKLEDECKLRRTISERFKHEPFKVIFLDSMALRSKMSKTDIRELFAIKDLEKLDGVSTKQRKISKDRPREAPPPPPPVVSNNFETKEEFPNKIDENSLKIAAQKTSDAVSIQLKESATTNSNNLIKELAFNNNRTPDNTLSTTEKPPAAPPRKRSNNKSPQINIVQVANEIPKELPIPKNEPVKVSTFTETEVIKTPIINESVKLINFSQNETKNESIKILSNVGKNEPVKTVQPINKTIVQVSPPAPVHKLQIKNEFEDTMNVQNVSITTNPQRKTSILINGDDCYSTMVSDEVPLYQSSVVVNDFVASPTIQSKSGSSSIYITGSFVGSNSCVDELTNKTTTDQKQPTENLIYLSSNTRSNQDTKKYETTTEVLHELLRDPVEAVKRNLVPHVCGKAEISKRSRDNKFYKTFSNSLLDQVLLETSLEKLEDSLVELRNGNYSKDDDKDACSEHSSSTQYELVDVGSDCYTDHSNRSSVTEEELANRTKFYELLADSALIEVSENDDHHYECIKQDQDPIYEEIEIPPPLPLNPPPPNILDDLQLDKEYTTRSIFEGASKYDILSYLVEAKERGIVQEDCYGSYNSSLLGDDSKGDTSEDNSFIISNSITDDKTLSKSSEVERNDSGVGSETSKSSLSKYRVKQDPSILCEDCETAIDQVENEPLLCRKCLKKRTERKEIITEIVETEEKYSRDLQIVLEEFYQPMLVAGLLTPEQLSAIFLNVEDLLENSQALAERLRDAVDIAIEQGDEDLLTVNIGKLFLEAAPMLHAFETYCIRQGSASLLLASLEKDKELLRIFLKVSQMENTLLRRMNLNSFLMVPVQRVTKYPLLLARLFKVTPTHHETREVLKEAQHKIELHLNHMNSETKDVPTKLWRRIASNSGRRASAEMDLVNIKLRKIAVDVLEWNHDDAKFALEGKLLFTQPSDNNWRKGRTIKLSPINALLVINGKPHSSRMEKHEESSLVFPKHSPIRDAALLLVRDKNGRYSMLREPLFLDRCIIAADPSWQGYFEVQELLGKDTFIFKGESEENTKSWYQQLQYHAQGMGAWRKRRNALANIMINGMGLRS